jgi:branched-chain amino acid transport system ATP-binding protein
MTATQDHVEEIRPVTPEALPPPTSRRGNMLVRFFRRFSADIRAFGQLRRTPYGLAPAIIFALVGFFQKLDSAAFSVAAPDIVRDTKLNIGAVIDIASIVGIMAVVAAVVLGWWADRRSRVPVFAVGTFLAGIAATLRGAGNTTSTIGASVVADDTFTVAADVPSYSLLADYYPPEARGRTFAFLGALSSAASLIALLFVGIMLSNFSWRTTLYVLGVPIMLMAIVAGLRLREPVRGYFERRAVGADEEVAVTEDEPQSLGEGWRSTFAVRTVRRFFMAYVVYGMGFEIVALLFPFYLTDRYGLTALERGYTILPGLALAIIGGVIGGGLVDRFSGRNPGRVLSVYGAFLCIAGLGVLGYAMHPPLWVLIAFNCVQSFGLALVGPARRAVFAQVIPPSIRTQGIQITDLSTIPGAIFGLQIGKLVFVNYGYQAVFLYGAPFFFLAGLVAMTAGGFFDSDRRNAFAQAVASEEYRRSRAAGNKKLLVCRHVDVDYDGVQVLFDVDFDVAEGECVALLGTNGAGKSTLLRAISGSHEASGGGIVFEGRDITHMPPHEVAARHVVHMPGGRGVFPGLTVRDNLMLGNWLSENPEETRAAIAETFEMFPVLRDRADAAAGSLSGGEQQMLSLAQAFLMKPKLLMIDELSLGLSPAVVGELLEIVREIKKRGVTIIVVEQSVNVALNIAERAVFMEKGEVKFVGPTADLLRRPDILRAVYVKGTGALTDNAPAATSRERQRLAQLEESRPILSVEHVTKRYGGIVAVDDASFDLRDGEVLGVIGPNGSGKTTLFDVISGFQPADEGLVALGGVDITRLGPEARVRAGLVRRFQDARLFPSLTVYETLLIALEERLEVKSTLMNAFGVPQARRAERRLRRRADRLIELLGIEDYRDKFVKELSTGLRRIVDLACVLATEPKVLLLDEPSSGVAQAEAEGLAPLLRRVRFETGCSILLIEHDMPLVSAVADELLALDQGQVVMRGKPDAVLNDPRVIESYLGGSEAAIRRSGSLS